MGELRSRDRGPSLPAAFAFWEKFPENNLEPQLGKPISLSSLDLTCHRDFLSSSNLQSYVLSLARDSPNPLTKEPEAWGVRPGSSGQVPPWWGNKEH